MNLVHRIVAALLSLGVAAFGVSLFLRPVAPPSGTAADFAARLIRNSASPSAWCDLAEARFQEDDIPAARACFRRALELGPNIPPVQIRAINFHFMLSEADSVLALSKNVLALVPDYDAILFQYFDQLRLTPDQVTGAISANRRAMLAWFDHLLSQDAPKSAAQAWTAISGLGYASDQSASGYVRYLLSRKMGEEAATTWANHLGSRRSDYLRSNYLFNSDFEEQPTGCAFDWNLDLSQAVTTERTSAVAHSGKYSLEIRFNGQENVDYSGTYQLAYLRPGRYECSAWIKTADLTTNQGVHIHVTSTNGSPVDVRSESLTGANDWTRVRAELTLTNPAVIQVRICREHSLKFDNKISGTAWVDQVSLVRVP